MPTIRAWLSSNIFRPLTGSLRTGLLAIFLYFALKPERAQFARLLMSQILRLSRRGHTPLLKRFDQCFGVTRQVAKLAGRVTSAPQ